LRLMYRRLFVRGSVTVTSAYHESLWRIAQPMRGFTGGIVA
jgi:hypothetical protein